VRRATGLVVPARALPVSLQQRLRAPTDDRGIVAEPPLAEAGKVLSANRLALAGTDLVFLGRSLADCRRQARHDIVQEAGAYLQAAAEPVPVANTDSLFLAGHQPELFHPGVWVKNFALNNLARRHGATPINLIVDNDIAKGTVLRLPTWKGNAGLEPWPRLVQVPFDRRDGEVPYEDRLVHDEKLFAGFPEQIKQLVEGWNFQPFLGKFWAEVIRQADRTPLLGERMAAARRSFERQWGCHNLEVPVSAMSRTEAFAVFALDLLDRLPAFHSHYNDVVREYRRRYGIRSRHHPVPDLGRDGDWLEAPFWAWRQGQNRRQRLFVLPASGMIQLRAGDESWPLLPGLEKNPQARLESWNALQAGDYKIRPRALSNTLFARLFLADLFVHGIGGGKYDELTDQVLRRVYRIKPPAFLILSATLLLPFPRQSCTDVDFRRLSHDLRDLAWNPQRHLPDHPFEEAQLLAREKQLLIEQSAGDSRLRYHRLRELTGRLRAFLADKENALRQQVSSCRHQVEANQILGRRDFAFCFHPETRLREFCHEFLNPPS
jgi:hypothetical protein